jgi:predicted nucleic acid-binding protein
LSRTLLAIKKPGFAEITGFLARFRIRVRDLREMRIYMDVCCLSRPFDDQTQERIYLESQALFLIFGKCQFEVWELIGSRAIELEISNDPDLERLRRIKQALSLVKTTVQINSTVTQRATEIITFGFKPYDALHLASAEVARADIFLTTDDRILRRGDRYREELQVPLANPANWLIAINQFIGDDNENPNGNQTRRV